MKAWKNIKVLEDHAFTFQHFSFFLVLLFRFSFLLHIYFHDEDLFSRLHWRAFIIFCIFFYFIFCIFTSSSFVFVWIFWSSYFAFWHKLHAIHQLLYLFFFLVFLSSSKIVRVWDVIFREGFMRKGKSYFG